MFPFGEGFQFDWYFSGGSQPAIILPLFPFHLTLEVNGSKHNLNIEIQEKNMWTIVSSMVSSSNTSILERILLDNFQTLQKNPENFNWRTFIWIHPSRCVFLAVCIQETATKQGGGRNLTSTVTTAAMKFVLSRWISGGADAGWMTFTFPETIVTIVFHRIPTIHFQVRKGEF